MQPYYTHNLHIYWQDKQKVLPWKNKTISSFYIQFAMKATLKMKKLIIKLCISVYSFNRRTKWKGSNWIKFADTTEFVSIKNNDHFNILAKNRVINIQNQNCLLFCLFFAMKRKEAIKSQQILMFLHKNERFLGYRKCIMGVWIAE